MKWTQEHTVGIPEIDKEHQAIFEGITALQASIRRKSRWSDIHSWLIDLNELTLMHFEVEESLMQIHGFAGLADHVEQHRGFSKRMQEYLQTSLTRSLTEDTVSFLDGWWEEHIHMSDRAYAEWFCAAGIASVSPPVRLA